MVMITVENVSSPVASLGIEIRMELAITAMIAAGASWLPDTVPGIEVITATVTPVIIPPMRANQTPLATKSESSPAKISAAKEMARITSTKPTTRPDVKPEARCVARELCCDVLIFCLNRVMKIFLL